MPSLMRTLAMALALAAAGSCRGGVWGDHNGPGLMGPQDACTSTCRALARCDRIECLERGRDDHVVERCDEVAATSFDECLEERHRYADCEAFAQARWVCTEPD